MTAESNRAARVAERIKEEISSMLLSGRVHDPDAQRAVVSKVSVTNDLSLARVLVRTLTEADAATQRRVVRALERAGGFVRRELAQSLGLRRVPELRFSWDTGIDHADRVEALLDEIAQERARKADT